MTRSEPNSIPQVSETSGGGSSQILLAVVGKRKSLLILGLLAGLLLSTLYYLEKRPIYQSSAQVLVVKKQPDALPIQALESHTSQAEDSLATHLTILKSPLVVSRAVKKGNLQELKSFRDKGDPTPRIIAALAVSRDNKENNTGSSVFDLSYKGPIPDECVTVLEAVIDSYRDFLNELYQNTNDDAATLIRSARDLLYKDLARTKADYSEFLKNSPIVLRNKDGTNLQQEQLAAIDARRAKLREKRAEILGRLSEFEKTLREGRNPAPLLELPQPGTSNVRMQTQSLEEQLLPLLQQENQLLEMYGKDHPEVKMVRRRIQGLRDLITHKRNLTSSDSLASITELARSQIESLKQELVAIRIQEEALTGLFESEHKTLKALSHFEFQDKEYAKKIELTEQLYTSILKRLQEVGLVKNYSSYSARIISPPRSGELVEPKVVPTFRLGMIGGLLAGLLLALIAEVSDKGFRNPDEVRRRLGLPVLSHVPILKPDKEDRKPVEAGQVVLDPFLCSHHRPESMEAEAFRGLRTALFSVTAGEGQQVILVSSPDTFDGKSTLAANLAISIAQSGKSALLVDADLRRPRLHKIFAAPAKPGLRDILEGGIEPGAALRMSPIPNLSLLLAGAPMRKSADLLTSPRLVEVFKTLRSQYDFVIVDSSPLLAVSDPSVIAPCVDGMLLVVRLGRHARPHAERAWKS